MNAILGVFALIFGIVILLIAIPQIDVTRSAVAAVVSSPIAVVFSTLLLLVVLAIVTSLVLALARS